MKRFICERTQNRLEKFFKETIEDSRIAIISGERRQAGKTFLLEKIGTFYLEKKFDVCVLIESTNMSTMEDRYTDIPKIRMKQGIPENGHDFRNSILLIDGETEIDRKFLSKMALDNVSCVGFINTINVMDA